MKRWLLFSETILASAMLAGCATISEMVDDPSVEHSVVKVPINGETGHVLMTLREDNRLVRRTVTADGALKICAETQADAISARSARSGLEVTGQGSIEDEITRRLTLTYARTQVSDVVRQIAWQLCNAHLNGQIGEEFYQSSLRSLQAQAMAVLAKDTGSNQADALKEMQVIQDKAAQEAAEERKADELREARLTEQAKQRTERMKLQQRTREYADCRKDNRDKPEELTKCVSPTQ